MEPNLPEHVEYATPEDPTQRSTKWGKVLLQGLLFVATVFTTTLAGVQWLNKDPTELGNFAFGLPYSICLLTVLSFHEFGHYFAARFHQVKTTRSEERRVGKECR